MTAQRISFTHTGLPNQCISPNILTKDNLEKYPGMCGTGFLARRGDQLFYITARHCLTNDNKVDVSVLAARLYVPFKLGGGIKKASDYIEFEHAISVVHRSNDLPGEWFDLLVLKIGKPKKEKDRKHLLSRAVKLPPSGEWLDNFFENPLVQKDISDGKGPIFTVIGYPNVGTNSEVSYPEKNSDHLKIHMQSAKFQGYLAKGSYSDRFKLTEITWEHDLNGFSGSPVFVGFKNENGHQYALVGMMVTGGGGMVQFIKISVIALAVQ